MLLSRARPSGRSGLGPAFLPAPKRTEALVLRVCPRSHLRRETGRWPRVLPSIPKGKAGSVSPLPARIALQGGETRGRRCDSVSQPQRRKNPAPEAPGCPPQESSNSGTCLAGPTAPGPRAQPSLAAGSGLPLRSRTQTARTEAFLRNLPIVARKGACRNKSGAKNVVVRV
jgi:hypothetical protein